MSVMGSLVRHLAWRCLRGGGIGRNIASAAATKPTSSSQGGGGVGNGATSGMVYGGPKAHDAEMKHVTGRRVTVRELPMFGKKKGDATKRLAVLTAYDYPSAVAADTAGADVLLVGDSLGMVVHGLDTTVGVTLDMMEMHCRAVVRGRKRAMIVCDLPFGTYEWSDEVAVRSSIKLLREGGADAVKLEGGSPRRIHAVRAITDAGIAVLGHVGLTPQQISVLGGFRPQGRSAESAMAIIREAKALEAAGAVALVVECVPSVLGAAVTAAVKIPTIGIGAGPYTSGQVLVYHDVLGLISHPHHEAATPKFCKKYANVGDEIVHALRTYVHDVQQEKYPTHEYSPYVLPAHETVQFVQSLEDEGLHECADAARNAGL